MNSTGAKVLKALAGVIVLAALILAVRGYIREYRDAPRTGSVDATQTSEPTDTESPADTPDQTDEAGADTNAPEERLEVTIDGLNLRAGPDSTADPIRGLKRGEIVTVQSKTGDWYQVTTEEDETGFITDNPGYTKAAK